MILLCGDLNAKHIRCCHLVVSFPLSFLFCGRLENEIWRCVQTWLVLQCSTEAKQNATTLCYRDAMNTSGINSHKICNSYWRLNAKLEGKCASTKEGHLCGFAQRIRSGAVLAQYRVTLTKPDVYWEWNLIFCLFLNLLLCLSAKGRLARWPVLLWKFKKMCVALVNHFPMDVHTEVSTANPLQEKQCLWS